MTSRFVRPHLQNLRAMFYLVTPNETSFEDIDDVPNYVDEAVPYFTILIILECVVLKIQGKDLPRINDGVNSMTHGLLSTMHALISRSIELVTYIWVYENFHFINLPWNSPFTWVVGMLATDFLYYWFHRFSHESNIVWASHQVHHSSEEYNLTTALRQSLMQKYYSMFLYLPMALCVPPSIFYIHQQFNLLYQFWIHTEVVSTLGPLEYILNTPSHHRVHHGRNPYCIDKNYAGTLIIWDRMFNTFQAEGEKVVYGLVHPNTFWSPVYGQFYHYLYIFGLVRNHKGLANKLSAVFKGPGWEPGKPWRGLYEDLPQIALSWGFDPCQVSGKLVGYKWLKIPLPVLIYDRQRNQVEQPVRKYNSNLPTWANVYVLIHFTLVIAFYSVVASYKKKLGYITSVGFVTYFIFSVSVFGAMYDHRKFSTLMEFLRCILSLYVCYSLTGPIVLESSVVTVLSILFMLSAAVWPILSLVRYDIHSKVKKTV